MVEDHWPTKWKFRIIEIGKIVGSLTTIFGSAALIWAAVYGPIREFFDTQAQIGAEITAIWDELDVMNARVAAASGDDRIIREQPGQTFVAEPVYQGDLVTFNMVVERTTLGQPCRLTRTVPMYVDTTRIPQPGPAREATRQIGGQQTFLQPRYEMPETLVPGRVAMHLILEYECPQSYTNGEGVERIRWEQVLDRTSVAVFRLRAGPRPPEE
jgi:hypothetical protein